MRKEAQYAVLLRPLPANDGGGWLAVVPDLPGCMSDGATGEEAFRNVQGAIADWKDEAEATGKSVPQPDTSLGQWRQRVPKTLHATLKEIAKSEGVSLNHLVATILAESVAAFGRRPGELEPSQTPAHSRGATRRSGIRTART